MKLILVMMLFSQAAFSQQTNAEKISAVENLQRLAFGSCNKQYNEQPLWKDLIQQSPDLFIWGGDNVYANTKNPLDILKSYQQQNQIEDYKFFKAITPIIGTWDDHDYGTNDGNGNYPIKKYSQHYALNFYEEPQMSARRLREGIYTSYDFGDTGKKIKIILLDNRYFKGLEKGSEILGSKQWKWLENEIKNSDASLHLVVSGLSVISPASPGSEEWNDYPAERMRLKKIFQSAKKPYLYMTGDKHFSSVFKRDGEYEFMASGMTHNTRLPLRPYVMARYPDPVFVYNYGMIDFSWENSSPVLTVSIRTAYEQSLHLKKLKWGASGWSEY